MAVFQLSTKLCEMTGLDQDGLVKLAIAGAFDAVPEEDGGEATQQQQQQHLGVATNDSAVVTQQTIEDDTAVMHEAEGKDRPLINIVVNPIVTPRVQHASSHAVLCYFGVCFRRGHNCSGDGGAYVRHVSH